MNTYLYAPKDDSKHRAYWRELYSIEEAEALRELIELSIQNEINFVYAISPGLDVTYSSQKDQQILKRKLDQVKQLGCKYFAILFDDIDNEMQQADKTQFKSFAEAQSFLSNELYQYLNEPDQFFFCPTEYCNVFARPNMEESDYLKTIGLKLLPNIRIFWTGPGIVSEYITIKHIKKIESILKRKPLIWENYHANDYDLKSVFLGPLNSRSPNLRKHLSGMLTNPNCEFECNYVPIYTLALWSHSKCKNDDVVLVDSDYDEFENEENLAMLAKCSSVSNTPGLSNDSTLISNIKTTASNTNNNDIEMPVSIINENEFDDDDDDDDNGLYDSDIDNELNSLFENDYENNDNLLSLIDDYIQSSSLLNSIDNFDINNFYYDANKVMNIAIKKWLPVFYEKQEQITIYKLPVHDVIPPPPPLPSATAPLVIESSQITESQLKNEQQNNTITQLFDSELSSINYTTKNKAKLDACNSLIINHHLHHHHVIDPNEEVEAITSTIKINQEEEEERKVKEEEDDDKSNIKGEHQIVLVDDDDDGDDNNRSKTFKNNLPFNTTNTITTTPSNLSSTSTLLLKKAKKRILKKFLLNNKIKTPIIVFKRKKRERIDGGELFKLRKLKNNKKLKKKFLNKLPCLSFLKNVDNYDNDDIKMDEQQTSTSSSSSSKLILSPKMIIDEIELQQINTNNLNDIELLSVTTASRTASIASSSSSSLSSSSTLVNSNNNNKNKKFNHHHHHQHHIKSKKLNNRLSPMDLGVGIVSTSSTNDTNNNNLDEFDLKILIDLYYLAFKYGKFSLYLLNEFKWLVFNAIKLNIKPSTQSKVSFFFQLLKIISFSCFTHLLLF